LDLLFIKGFEDFGERPAERISQGGRAQVPTLGETGEETRALVKANGQVVATGREGLKISRWGGCSEENAKA